MGKYLSRKRKCETLKVDAGARRASMKYANENHQVEIMLKHVQEYHKEYGIEKSCYIYREMGEDISLMAEIVNQKGD